MLLLLVQEGYNERPTVPNCSYLRVFWELPVRPMLTT